MSQSNRTEVAVAPVGAVSVGSRVARGLRKVPRRWLRIGLLAAIVFAINVAGRLVVRIGSVTETDLQNRISVSALVGIALAMATVAIVWGRRRPVGEVSADLAGAGLLGGLLALFVGPSVSDTTFWAVGLDDFLIQTGLYAAYAGGGALLGLFLVILAGRDYRSRSLTRFAESKLAKPRRTT